MSDAREGRPVLHWVPVVDGHGRTHMEMRWGVGSDHVTPAPHAA